MKLIAVSGGFDPIHVGHVRMIQDAAKLGRVLVIVNNDNWLRAKKGYVFMPELERVEIINALSGVFRTVLTEHVSNDPDRSVCRALTTYRPDIFGNGGDRGKLNTPEIALCQDLAIDLVWNLGGGKVQSSSELVANAHPPA